MSEGSSGGGLRSIVDLHVHTTHMSMDSGLRPDEMVRRAKAAGLTAVAVTEHNAVWRAGEARALSEHFEFPVLRGMEISTDAGHVLCFGLERYTMEMYELDELNRIAKSEGAALVLPHPLREPGFGKSWEEAPQFFEGLESHNADDSRASVRLVEALATKLGMPTTGGSDAHSAPAVGRHATVFETLVETDRELVEALKSGRFRPVDLTAEVIV